MGRATLWLGGGVLISTNLVLVISLLYGAERLPLWFFLAGMLAVLLSLPWILVVSAARLTRCKCHYCGRQL